MAATPRFAVAAVGGGPLPSVAGFHVGLGLFAKSQTDSSTRFYATKGSNNNGSPTSSSTPPTASLSPCNALQTLAATTSTSFDCKHRHTHSYLRNHVRDHFRRNHRHQHTQTRSYATSASLPNSSCPYEILGVAKNATMAQVKKAYYQKVFVLHPDRQKAALSSSEQQRKGNETTNKDNDAFVRVVRAYEILSDPDRRRQYDFDRSRGYTSTYSSGGGGVNGNPYASYSTRTVYHDPTRNRAHFYADTAYYDHFYSSSSAYYAAQPPPQNTGPIFMSNGKMASLILAFCVLSSFMSYYHIKSMRSWFTGQMDRNEGKFRDAYERAVQKGRENGFEGQIRELLRRKAERARNGEEEKEMMELELERERKRVELERGISGV
ncbi:hypothetical protein HK102_001099 [Quaeritorhiza haematococci]|nr:hypothetical protein HK102_001099 [Quaeritorhiza haematococci]